MLSSADSPYHAHLITMIKGMHGVGISHLTKKLLLSHRAMESPSLVYQQIQVIYTSNYVSLFNLFRHLIQKNEHQMSGTEVSTTKENHGNLCVCIIRVNSLEVIVYHKCNQDSWFIKIARLMTERENVQKYHRNFI